jgi:aldose 1-epimerase
MENRIAQNGFHVDGRWISLPPNSKDEPLPIHGRGWQHAWQV